MREREKIAGEPVAYEMHTLISFYSLLRTFSLETAKLLALEGTRIRNESIQTSLLTDIRKNNVLSEWKKLGL